MRTIKDTGIVERLEEDLILKITKALDDTDIQSRVHGVFSLDDLEAKAERDLDGLLAIGVGYQGARNMSQREATGSANKATLGQFQFMVLFAAPTDEVCSQRTSATAIMTVLRNGILGKAVEVASGKVIPGREWANQQRGWEWVEERPQVDDSTSSMLYYTQIWRITLPVGN